MLRLDAETRCNPQVDGFPASVPVEGYTGTLQITAEEGCPWSYFPHGWSDPNLDPPNPNRNVEFPSAGGGPGSVDIGIPRNDSAAVRTHTFAGSMETTQLTQLTSQCQSPMLNPAAVSFPAAGGPIVVLAAVPDGCPLQLTTVPDTPWVSVAISTRGGGRYVVTLNASANPGPLRSGSVRVGNVDLPLAQQSSVPSVVAFPDGPVEVGPEGGTLTIPFTVDPDCGWTAASTAAWATIATASTGTGCSGMIDVTVEPYTANALRNGELLINGTGIRIRQFGFDVTAPAELQELVDAARFFNSLVGADGLASLFGKHLATTIEQATSLPLPTILGGVRVLFENPDGSAVFAPLLYVSPGQINLQIPPGVLGAAKVRVIAEDRASNTLTTQPIREEAPSLFQTLPRTAPFAHYTPAGYAHLFLPDGTERITPLSDCNAFGDCVRVPVDRGPEGRELFITLFGTGFPANAAPEEYEGPSWQPAFTLSYAGPQGQFVGLHQFNIRIPRSVEIDGFATLDVSVRGVPSQQIGVDFAPLE